MKNDEVVVSNSSPLRKLVCMHCRYHLVCKYNLKHYGGVRMFIMRNLFDPEGIMFGCDARLPGCECATDEVTINMKWDDIEKEGKDAWDEVQRAIRF